MTTYAGTSVSGIVGIAGTSTINVPAVSAQATGTGASAAAALNASSTAGDGVAGASASSAHSGVWGNNTGGGYGVAGSTDTAENINAGVWGTNSSDGYGVLAEAYGDSSIGLAAFGNQYAAKFNGNVTVGGTLSKTAGTFLIDHPQDPANKYLRHAFVESPEMKNIYDGIAVADEKGEIFVEMPSYFESLNTDFRYQLTPMGAPAAQLHIKSELNGGRFGIGGANARQRISWQVTGVRKDAYALAHPIVVEEQKPPNEQGRFRHPEVHGEPASKGLVTQRFTTVGPDGK